MDGEQHSTKRAHKKIDKAFQNIRYINPRVSSNLNQDSLALDPVKYLGNPLGYIEDIIGGLYIVII